MSSTRNTNSEASSIENYYQTPEKFNDRNNACTGRWYECTFCKRGFNNAQALGGHMNIHRKDKAKAKKKCNNKPKEEHITSTSSTCRYFEPIYSIEKMNYQFYISELNPSFPHAYYQDDSNLHEEILGTNLSLQIGAYHMEDSNEGEKRDENTMENVVDLELRLGYDP